MRAVRREQVLPQNKHRDIFATLKSDIVNGRCDFSKPLPSVAALMRKFGVARATAVAALKSLEREGLVVSKRGSGTFVKNCVASRKIGLIVPGVAYSEIYPPIVSEILKQAQMADYKLYIGDMSCADSKDWTRQIERIVAEYAKDHVSGVILQPFEYAGGRGSYTDKALALLKSINVPVVLLGYDIVALPERSDYDVVGINNYAAGARVAEHLAEQGAKRIFFLNDSVDRSISARDRIIGIADVLGPKRFTMEKNVFTTRADDVAAIRNYVRRHRPDAIICCNDAVAAMMKQTLGACGISVPKDIMLAGFDDVNIARLTQITSVRQPCCSIARAAFRRLVERIGDPAIEPAEIYLNAPLMRRGSTEREPCQADRGKEKVHVAASKDIAKKRTRP